MEYQKEVTEIISELAEIHYEDWMDDSDKEELKDKLMEKEGQSVSDYIQKGIDIGYQLDFQMIKVREYFKQIHNQ